MTCSFWRSLVERCGARATFAMGQALRFCSDHAREIIRNVDPEILRSQDWRQVNG